MVRAHPSEIKYLKSKIRLFEDRKISAADLSREVYYVAREIFDPDEANLRRTLEVIGNKIAVIGERGRGLQSHSEVLELVDQIQSELIDQGY